MNNSHEEKPFINPNNDVKKNKIHPNLNQISNLPTINMCCSKKKWVHITKTIQV